MKIIIPMAGHSRRFEKAGYLTPKPFLKIDGKPMIERVCRMFAQSDEFIFICNSDHLKNREFVNILESSAQNHQIISIKPHELGPVYSTVQIHKKIENSDEPIIVTYCDFVMKWNYQQFLGMASQYDGAIAAFKGFHPASFGDTYYAYMRINQDSELLELREKESFTKHREQEPASTGVYYFESWNLYYQYAEKLLKTKIKFPEYYCSLVYNPMLTDGKRVGVYEVEKFVCWGTPEDFKEYQFWSSYFARDVKQFERVPHD